MHATGGCYFTWYPSPPNRKSTWACISLELINYFVPALRNSLTQIGRYLGRKSMPHRLRFFLPPAGVVSQTHVAILTLQAFFQHHCHNRSESRIASNEAQGDKTSNGDRIKTHGSDRNREDGFSDGLSMARPTACSHVMSGLSVRCLGSSTFSLAKILSEC